GKTKHHEFFDPKTGQSKGRGPATQIVFADQGVNPLNGFHAYGWMVRELVRMGVPRNQIALINDYKSHAEKQKLFAKAKTGEVRILIGSTAKLGTGTNIQDRLYAIHNADPQWYPAADEQRVGRIVRQGNFNRAVEVHDYSVKGTYDATMWKMMGKKARFIEEFFRGDPNLREMEDLGEASMYEQASGMTVTDDRVLRLVTLKQELSDAKRKRISHAKDQARVRENIHALSREIDTLEERIPLIEKDLAQRVDVSGEKFQAIINEKTITRRTDAGEMILHSLESAPDDKSGNRKIGEIGGFDLHIDIERRKDSTGEYAVKRVQLRRNVGETDWRVHSGTTSTGIMQGIEHHLRAIDQELAKARDRIQEARDELAGYEKRVGAPFTGQERIDTLQRQVKALEEDLTAHPEKQEEETTQAEPPPESTPANDATKPASGGFFDGEVKQSRPANTTPSTLLTDKARQSLVEHLARFGLDDKIAVKLTDLLRGDAQRAGAVATYFNRMIEIATDHGNPMAALNHEIIHALRDLGVMRLHEWTTLRRHVEANTTLMNSIAERYPELSHEARIEEAIADRFSEWMDAASPRGFIEQAVSRTRGFFEAMGNWLHGLGFRNATDVFGSIASGEVGKRQAGEGNHTAEMKFWRRPTIQDVRDTVQQVRPLMAGTMGRRQLVEVYSGLFPNQGKALNAYDKDVQEMGAYVSKKTQEAAQVAEDWGNLSREDARNLAEVMHAATVWEFHPDGKFSPHDLQLAEMSHTASDRARQAFRNGHDMANLTPAEKEDFDTLNKAVQNSTKTLTSQGLVDTVAIYLNMGLDEKSILDRLSQIQSIANPPQFNSAQERTDALQAGMSQYNALDGETKLKFRAAAVSGKRASQQKMHAFKNGHQIGKLDAADKKTFDRLEQAYHKHKAQVAFERQRAQEAEKALLLYDNLSEDAKRVYQQSRDMYQDRYKEERNALEERIRKAAELSGAFSTKEAERLIATLRLKFEKAMVSRGPYFPLSRFGRYTVYATGPGLDPVFSMEETSYAQTQLEQALRKEGYTRIERGYKGEFSEEQKETAPQFVKDVIKIVDGSVFDAKSVRESPEAKQAREAMKDEIWQTYLQTLPAFSVRRRFIHRSRIAGWSNNALRGFAQHMFHSARQTARLKYAYKLQESLDRMAEEVAGRRSVMKERQLPGGNTVRIKGVERLEGVDRVAPENQVKASQVLNEMLARHKLLMNPPGSVWTNRLNAVGFVLYLGFSPAAGLVNLLQTPMVALPIIGARYGFAATSREFAGVLREYGSNPKDGFALTDKKHSLSDEERAMLKTLVERGAIDVTMAHDLAGIAHDSGMNPLSGPVAKFMKMAGWFFHVAERTNREATALTVYRLARNQGMSKEDAVNEADRLTYKTHFDYSFGNRPRFMQGNVARVVTQFKQFGQNTAYTFAREVYQSVKGESPEARKEARHALAGLLLTHFIGAGVAGVPLVWVVPMIMNAVASAFGSDDEPYDAEAWMRNLLADNIGKLPGELIAHGPMRLTGIDLAHRVGVSDLFWKSSDRSMEGADAFAHDISQMLGPTVGYIFQLYNAAKVAGDGHKERALEMVLPKAFRDVVKSGRYIADGGVLTMKGARVMEDQLSSAELLAVAIGFTPSSVAERYAANNVTKEAEKFITERRRELLNQFGEAFRNKDETGRERAKAAFLEFNRHHPRYGITVQTVMESLQAHARNMAMMKDGIAVNRKLNDVRELGRFAR
ncbi:MAG: PLxRFG domain-containing protein, partial [Magnetococcales bacterium]|nr:PLxRFG domain-containing protein [Magnetococcales bacterium]